MYLEVRGTFAEKSRGPFVKGVLGATSSLDLWAKPHGSVLRLVVKDLRVTSGTTNSMLIRLLDGFGVKN
jgi:hypothetical protein